MRKMQQAGGQGDGKIYIRFVMSTSCASLCVIVEIGVRAIFRQRESCEIPYGFAIFSG